MKIFAFLSLLSLLLTGMQKAHAQPGETEECPDQTTDLADCLTPAGLTEAESRVCQTCLTTEARAAGAIGIACDTLSGAGNALCTAVGKCPACPETCNDEIHEYALCVLNEAQDTECSDFTCLLGDPEPTDPNAATTEETAGTSSETTEETAAETTEETDTETGPPTEAPPPTVAPTSSAAIKKAIPTAVFGVITMMVLA